jgi:hypothetical protein
MDRQTWQRLQVRVADEGPTYVVAGLLFAVCFGLFWAYRLGDAWTNALLTNLHLYIAAAFGLLIVDIVLVLGRDRQTAPISFLVARYRERLADPVILSRLPLLAVAIAFMPCFAIMKSMIPLFNSARWDPEFAAWDRTLLFGHDAVDVLQPLMGNPLVTSALSMLYYEWLLLIYVGVLFFLFYRAAEPVSRQFFLSFLLTWTLIGVVMATAFPSVGPCFVGPIFGDATFDAHMAYLRAADAQFAVSTLDSQQLLLSWYQSGERVLGGGISAMPSMHVAMAHLTWLAMRRVSRPAARRFLAFTALIWLGSVHLGYHYAVDGLVSIVASTAIWSASGLVLRAWDRRHLGWLGGKVALPA